MKDMYKSLNESMFLDINGNDVDLNRIIKTYGFFTKKFASYAYLIGTTSIDMAQAKEILDPLYLYHMQIAESVMISENFIENIDKKVIFKI